MAETKAPRTAPPRLFASGDHPRSYRGPPPIDRWSLEGKIRLKWMITKGTTILGNTFIDKNWTCTVIHGLYKKPKNLSKSRHLTLGIELKIE